MTPSPSQKNNSDYKVRSTVVLLRQMIRKNITFFTARTPDLYSPPFWAFSDLIWYKLANVDSEIFRTDGKSVLAGPR